MIDDPDLMARKIAYIDTVRGMYKTARLIGFVGCLVGVLLMFLGRFRDDVPDWLVWVGVAVVAASWALFAYVIFKRTAWHRAHPFDTWTPT